MKIEELYTLKNLKEIKVLAEPIRMRILQALSHNPMTTKQVARILGEKPTKLYHHVETMERVGLIKLVKTQKNRGTVEKYYQATALEFAIDKKLFTLRPPKSETIGAVQMMTLGALETTLAEIRQSIVKSIKREDEREAILAHFSISATPQQIEKLKKELQEWLKKCLSVSEERSEIAYGLTFVFYPIVKRVG